jgi:Na+-translocating ferredoxin:NAD+ oxidoreductase RnfG subunit
MPPLPTETEHRPHRAGRWQAALLLALVAAMAGIVISLVAQNTDQRIFDNRQQRVLAVLADMLPSGSYNNNPATTLIDIKAPGPLQTRSAVANYEQSHDQAWSAQFDQISGATITTSAVIAAVQRISNYHQQHVAFLRSELHRLMADQP